LREQRRPRESNIAKFLVTRSKFHSLDVIVSQSRTNTLRDGEQTRPSWNLQLLIRYSAAKLCFPLRNVATLFAGALKNNLCEEQASEQTVLLWLGCMKKELFNANTDRFVRHRRRAAHGINRNGADTESECPVLSEEQPDGAAELHVSDHGAVRAGQG
jgi:hypothetical protein